MKKKRILCVGELSTLNTGLAIYNRNLIQKLIDYGHEVIEFCIGFTRSEPNIKWSYILNQPSSKEEEEIFNNDGNNINGLYKFEKTLLETKPDLVIDLRDPFSYSYQTVSPFRKLFGHIIMAPVDGLRQRRQWLEMYKKADALFVYTQFGKDTLEKEGIKVNGIAPPSISSEFTSKQTKEKFGLSEYRILGSILRNQPRKFIPELFEGFRKYLDKYGDNKTLLYLHTCILDVGWNIPELLIQHGLSSKVLFTYSCKNCESVFPSFYRGLRSFCPKCKQPAVRTVELSDNVTDSDMSDFIGCFDGYIQLAGREGFGMTQLEALSCGVPVLTIDYSAMGDFAEKYGSLTIKPAAMKYTHDMEMYDAVVAPEDIADKINELFKVEKVCGVNCSWDKSLKPIIDFVNESDISGDWKAPLDIKPIPEYKEFPASNYDYAKYLITNILQKPEYLYSPVFTRLVDELNCGVTFGRNCQTYLLEPNHMRGQTQPFDRPIAYEYMVKEREKINFWELQRKESFK